jgi:hypothetical protein
MHKFTILILLGLLTLVALPAAAQQGKAQLVASATPTGGDEGGGEEYADIVARLEALEGKDDDSDEDGEESDSADFFEMLEALEEDVEDLLEPIEEFDLFDQCMFMVGVTENTGYAYTTKDGRQVKRAALAMDMAGPGNSQWDFLAFPGEEPPQIECNEDAGGEFTDE